MAATETRTLGSFNEIAQIRIWHKSTTDTPGKPVSPRSDGYLGSYDFGMFEIEIIPEEGRYLVLRQDQDREKTLHPIGSYPAEHSWKLFRHTVLIYPGKLGLGITKYPTNHVKLVRIYSNEKAETVFQLWEIAIVAQYNGENNQMGFFLTTQMTNESQIYKDTAGNILLLGYPGFTNWESLRYYTTMLVGTTEMPDIALWPAEKKQEPQKFENNTGKVLWYNLAQQFGLVTFGKDGQVARIHWSQIRSDGHLKRLEANQMITFSALVLPHQVTTRATTVPWELKGVEVIS